MNRGIYARTLVYTENRKSVLSVARVLYECSSTIREEAFRLKRPTALMNEIQQPPPIQKKSISCIEQSNASIKRQLKTEPPIPLKNISIRMQIHSYLNLPAIKNNEKLISFSR